MAPRQRDINVESVSPTAVVEKGKGNAEKIDSPADLARDQHDIFNLFALIPVVVLTLSNWDYAQFVRGEIEESWHGQFFLHLWGATFAYFAMDLWWVYRTPICVKSPGMIIKHHIIAIVYLLGPLKFREFEWIMGLIISVEINTWFLIARRVFVYRRDFRKPLSDVITGAFYASWIVIRCIIYPGVLVVYLRMAHEGIIRTQSIMHIQLLFVPLHAVLVLLNLKWTYDLFLPITRQWLRIDSKSAATGVSSGL